MISERSCGTEDWSTESLKKVIFTITGITFSNIFKELIIYIFNNITVFYNKKAALVSIKKLFKNLNLLKCSFIKHTK